MIRGRTEHLLALCHRCGTESPVTESHIPATRYDPPEGEQSPEECPECHEPWGGDTLWRADEIDV